MTGLLSLATALPPHVLRTEDVVREAGAIFDGRHRDFEPLLPVFGISGINVRHPGRP